MKKIIFPVLSVIILPTPSITLANDDPPVESAGTVTISEDTDYSGTLSASDVDGDALTYSITTSSSNGLLSITTTTGTSLSFDGSDDYIDC